MRKPQKEAPAPDAAAKLPADPGGQTVMHSFARAVGSALGIVAATASSVLATSAKEAVDKKRGTPRTEASDTNLAAATKSITKKRKASGVRPRTRAQASAKKHGNQAPARRIGKKKAPTATHKPKPKRSNTEG